MKNRSGNSKLRNRQWHDREKQLRRRWLLIEQLEDRRMLAQVQWILNSDGFWDVPGNWSTGSVPSAADDVTIDRGVSNPLVTIRNTQSVRSIQSTEAMVLTGGTLFVGQTIDASNMLILTGGTISGGTLNLLNSTQLTMTSSGGILTGVTVNGDLSLLDDYSRVVIAGGTISVSSLVFTAANWNTPQTVTVTGVDDLLADGDVAYSIVTSPADAAHQTRQTQYSHGEGCVNLERWIQVLPL